MNESVEVNNGVEFGYHKFGHIRSTFFELPASGDKRW
jgi:hypothetical protein